MAFSVFDRHVTFFVKPLAKAHSGRLLSQTSTASLTTNLSSGDRKNVPVKIPFDLKRKNLDFEI